MRAAELRRIAALYRAIGMSWRRVKEFPLAEQCGRIAMKVQREAERLEAEELPS